MASLTTYKMTEYAHAADAALFDAIAALVARRDDGGEWVLIGNCTVGGAPVDALVAGMGGIRAVVFKDCGGAIRACENGAWTSDGMTVEGGAGCPDALGQMRRTLRRVVQGLMPLGAAVPQAVGGAVVFGRTATIDTTELSDATRRWLTVCDINHLDALFDGLDGHVLTAEQVRGVPTLLGLTDDVHIDDDMAYEPESTDSLFDELEAAVGFRPDYDRVYEGYNRVFRRFLDQQTRHVGLTLGGTFAKTDYLLKEHHAPQSLVQHTNDTRVRLRRRDTPDDRERHCLYDLANLCRFMAFVGGSGIPDSLAALFPGDEPPSSARRMANDCMRVIVERWDDDSVYVRTDDGVAKVCYSHGNRYYDYDWTYLRNMFHEGAQLNLVRPRSDGDTIYPELIIYEPDYLVNISTVAHCFTNYADSPYVELVKKLEPSQTSEAIVLGNLAGQLLDEAIHRQPTTRTYAESAKTFFEDNAVGLLTTDIGPTFKDEALRQKANIERAINEALPTALHSFNAQDGIVEPSFFSEMLGLQGRMDYLQMDFKVLMEQKSGKGAFPYGNFSVPRQTDEHYVQMLLYMALIRYNYREVYERNGKELHAFLLYSKYNDSLLGLGFSPELMFKAIKVRNGIAWTELQYTHPDGYRILDSLTPEMLNMKKVDNPLWNNYQRRQIADILTPIHEATDLERAYYYRFLTFISNEHAMSKLGSRTREGSGFAATWHDTLADKLAAGNIYDRLTLVSPDGDTAGRVESVTLMFSETPDGDMSNFRVGDIVILYPYDKGSEPDARTTMVFRCTIGDITADSITLTLRAAQSDNRIFVREQGKLWAIEHDFMEASYNPLYKGMQAFLTAPKARRDLLLLQRPPAIDGTATLKGDYGAFNDLVLRAKRAKDMFLVVGPPGTGKTTYGLMYTVEEELAEPTSTVLLLSYTNRAVDEICSKLVGKGIDFIRLGSTHSCAAEYRSHLLSSLVRRTATLEQLRAALLSARVVVGTTTALGGNIALLKQKTFSLAVVDEASQILEPHLIGLLSAGNGGVPAIRKFVLIGDHKQLPAVVQQDRATSRVHDALLGSIHMTDCRHSLFERLLARYGDDPDVTYMLCRQGRMHHDIALFPNMTFYNGRLTEVPLARQTAQLPPTSHSGNGIVDLLTTRRIAFLASEDPPKDSPDKVNQPEADMIAAVVVAIYNMHRERDFDADSTVGVIVPYRNQIAAVRTTIEAYGIAALRGITIDTVERYQGSQRRYIVYGFTAHRYHQLAFLTDNVFEDTDGTIVDRKLNVAMTRAEEHLVMIGNPRLLSNSPIFLKLIDFAKSRHSYFDICRNDFVGGMFSVD